MSVTWALHDAKNRLSEVVDRAATEGPQTITRRGKAAAVVMSFDEFTRLSRGAGDLVAFFRESPLTGLELQLERDDDRGRNIDL